MCALILSVRSYMLNNLTTVLHQKEMNGFLKRKVIKKNCRAVHEIILFSYNLLLFSSLYNVFGDNRKIFNQFTFKPQRNVHVNVIILLRQGISRHLSSEHLPTIDGRQNWSWGSYFSKRLLLVVFVRFYQNQNKIARHVLYKNTAILILHIYIRLICSVVSNGLWKLVKVSDHWLSQWLFCPLTAFADCAIWIQYRIQLTWLRSMYSRLLACEL